jgi:hypothetical protein
MSLARVRVAVGAAGFALVLSVVSARAADAQDSESTLIAGVADVETGQPLEGAEVILVRLRRLARANGMGEATIAGVPRGVQRVRVRRLGYAPAEVDLAITGDTTGAVFRLERTAAQLGTVRVEAEWMPPKMKDVDARRRRGIGRFLTDVELDSDRDRDFALAMVTRFPGLRMVTDPAGRRLLATGRSVQRIAGGRPCLVVTYLDDVLIDPQDADLIRTWDLAAVEFYMDTQVPARYRTREYGCGVMLLWSKWY